MQLRKLTVPSSEVVDLIEAERLHKSGYSPIRGMNNSRVLARIDTPEWRKIMAEDASYQWVSGLGFEAANVYRNRYTKDRILVPARIYNRVRRLAVFFYWNDFQERIGVSRDYYVK